MKTNSGLLLAAAAAVVHIGRSGQTVLWTNRPDHEAFEAATVHPVALAAEVSARKLSKEEDENVPPVEFDGFNTPSVQCRLELEKLQNKNIEEWMRNPEFPNIEYIWELTEEATGDTYYQGLLHVLLCGFGSCSQDRASSIMDYDWSWQDQSGKTYNTVAMQVFDVEYEPRIYFRLNPPKSGDNTIVPNTLTAVNGASTKVYNLQPYLKCNSIELDNPPPPNTKIGACIARFWGQHDLMPEWIAYHRMIGIQHFWIFVSEPFENIYHTMPRYERDISYIPYNFTWEGHKDHGDESMITMADGFNAGGENWFQDFANNQCLYMAKQYNLDWVITPDVDEYIVINDPNITHFGSPSPLQQMLEKHEINKGRPKRCRAERKKEARARRKQQLAAWKKAKQAKKEQLNAKEEEEEEDEAKDNDRDESVPQDTEADTKEENWGDNQDDKGESTAAEELVQELEENKSNEKADIPASLEGAAEDTKVETTQDDQEELTHNEANEQTQEEPGDTKVETPQDKQEELTNSEANEKTQEWAEDTKVETPSDKQEELNDNEAGEETREESSPVLERATQEKPKRKYRRRRKQRNQRRRLGEVETKGEKDDTTSVVEYVLGKNGDLIMEYDGPIRQICLYGASYGKHPNLETDKEFELSLDFTYRRDKQYNSGECRDDGHGAGGRRKCFVNPQLVTDVHVHGMRDDQPLFRGTSHALTDEVELFHFRSPLLGPRHTKDWKEQLVKPDKLVSYPRARDMYRDKIKEVLQGMNWTLPQFGKHVCKGYKCRR